MRAESTSLKLRGGADQASDRAGVSFSARVAPSEKFSAVAVAEGCCGQSRLKAAPVTLSIDNIHGSTLGLSGRGRPIQAR